MEEQYKSYEQLRRNQLRGEQFGTDEVELKDYLIVLLKWKWLIILGTFITTFTAGVVSFILPKVYKITTIIQPPRVAFLNEKEGGGIQLKELESPITLKGIIEGRTFDEQIRSDLNLKEAEYPKIKLQIPKDTTLIELSIESAKPDQAKLVLEKLVSILRGHYRDRINLEKENIDTKIRELNIKIENLKNRIIFGDEDYKTNKENLKKRIQLTKENYNIKKKDLENKIKTTEEDHKIKIENMKKKIDITKENLGVVLKQKEIVNHQLEETKERIDKLIEERKKAMTNNPNDSMAVLLYTNDMQNNQRYYNDLQTSLTFDLGLRERDLKKTIEDSQRELNLLEISLKKSMEDLKNQLEILENSHKSNLESLQHELEMFGIDYKESSEKLQGSIESSQIQVENMESLKNNIQELKIHKYPTIPERPTKPKKGLNVMIAFFVGGFLMVFLAFFLEYLQKIKLTPEQ